MTQNSVEGTSGKPVAPGSSATPKQLMEQFVSLLNQGADSDLQQRIAALQHKFDSLSQRLESANAGTGGLPSSGSFIVSDKLLGDKFKKLLTSTLFESGILERFVALAVEKKLAELKVSPSGQGPANAEELRKESAKLVKEFLSQNLRSLFQNEIRGAIQKELQSFLASEDMKIMIDNKFRAVQLYLTSDVVPTTVKQILQKYARQKA